MKYAVIFKAQMKNPDKQYSQMAKQMRDIAKEHYHCQSFISYMQGDQEIAISYWNTIEDIQAFKNDERHVLAQKLGKIKWYSNYQIDIVEIKHSHQFP